MQSCMGQGCWCPPLSPQLLVTVCTVTYLATSPHSLDHSVVLGCGTGQNKRSFGLWFPASLQPGMHGAPHPISCRAGTQLHVGLPVHTKPGKALKSGARGVYVPQSRPPYPAIISSPCGTVAGKSTAPKAEPSPMAAARGRELGTRSQVPALPRGAG